MVGLPTCRISLGGDVESRLGSPSAPLQYLPTGGVMGSARGRTILAMGVFTALWLTEANPSVMGTKELGVVGT